MKPSELDIYKGLRLLASLAFTVLLFYPCLVAGQSVAAATSHSAKALAAPRPASVTLKDGMLTVDANNSELKQILQDISQESGMIIDGSVIDTRVYGKYGPQKPSTVLSELLRGLGYNIMMAGSACGGAPRELVLTARTDGPTPAASFSTPVANQAERVQPTLSSKPEEPKLGPGAIAHPPPEPSNDPQVRAQQSLQRLQQMHEAQETPAPPR